MIGETKEDAPVNSERLMERVVERDTLIRALRQVKRNRGSPGMDGMRVEALPGYLKGHWPAIKASLTEGTYQPFKHRANSGGHRRIWVEAHLAVSFPPDEADRQAPTQFAAGGFVTDAAVESRTKDM
ncbi:MAG: hypothetical protein ACREXR_14675, partial [Gammaproteobacteria bacterium]